MAGVKFSRPIITVSYDPATETTVVEAYTVDVVLRNLMTQEVREVPKGNRGIVRKERITVSPLGQRESQKIEEEPEEETPVEEDIKVKSNSLLLTRDAVRQSTSATVPSSIGSIGTGEILGTGPVESEDLESSDDSDTTAESGDSAGGGAETSSNPSPGVRPSRPDRQSKTIRVHIEN